MLIDKKSKIGSLNILIKWVTYELSEINILFCTSKVQEFRIILSTWENKTYEYKNNIDNLDRRLIRQVEQRREYHAGLTTFQEEEEYQDTWGRVSGHFLPKLTHLSASPIDACVGAVSSELSFIIIVSFFCRWTALIKTGCSARCSCSQAYLYNTDIYVTYWPHSFPAPSPVYVSPSLTTNLPRSPGPFSFRCDEFFSRSW